MGLSNKLFVIGVFLTMQVSAFDEGQKISNLEIESDCRAIHGIYLPEGFSQSDKLLSEKYKHPRIGWRLFGMESLDAKIMYVEIDLDISLNLLAKVYDINNDILAEKNFNSGYRYCENGWLIYVTKSTGGSGETGVVDSRTTIGYAKSKNGDLIVHHIQKDIHGRWFLKREEGFEIWTIFPQKKEKEG